MNYVSYFMIRLLLILIITVINITIATLPAIMIFSLGLRSNVAGTMLLIKYAVFSILLVYCTYLLIDFILGITMKFQQIKSKSYRFSSKYEKLLETPLILIRKKYNMPHIKLFVSDSETIEHYSMASALEKYVCLSVGMLNALHIRAKSPEEFQILSCVILAKQAYNLRSGNYLPNMLLRNNIRIVTFIGKIFGGIFKILCFIIKYIPVIGPVISDIFTFINGAISFVLGAVNRILLNIYAIVDFVTSIYIQSKGDEYAAKAIGGQYVAHALGITEEETTQIFTIVPRLRKRISKVQNIKRMEEQFKIYPIYQIMYGIIIASTFVITGILTKSLFFV